MQPFFQARGTEDPGDNHDKGSATFSLLGQAMFQGPSQVLSHPLHVTKNQQQNDSEVESFLGKRMQQQQQITYKDGLKATLQDHGIGSSSFSNSTSPSQLQNLLQHSTKSPSSSYQEDVSLGEEREEEIKEEKMGSQEGGGEAGLSLLRGLSLVRDLTGVPLLTGPDMSSSVSSVSSPAALLEALDALQRKVGALQAMVPHIPQQGGGDDIVRHQAAAAAAEVAGVISQLAAAAAGMLPTQQQQSLLMSAKERAPFDEPLDLPFRGTWTLADGNDQFSRFLHGLHNSQGQDKGAAPGARGGTHSQPSPSPDEAEDEEDDGPHEPPLPSLPSSDYETVEMDVVEILAEHTHFCSECGKGFKRDANLRMHMRGHGEEYKTVAALVRPPSNGRSGEGGEAGEKPKRYSCPYVGCKRNQRHKKFVPLKTTLCVKNHYRRSHCPKMLTCSKCKEKKFSVVADLKTHEKHCGREKWQCSCGTTFSRKDKLLGHLSLFSGHTPAFPMHQIEEAIKKPNESANAIHNEREKLVAQANLGHFGLSNRVENQGGFANVSTGVFSTNSENGKSEEVLSTQNFFSSSTQALFGAIFGNQGYGES